MDAARWLSVDEGSPIFFVDFSCPQLCQWVPLGVSGGAWEKDLHDRWWTSKLPFPSTLSSTPHTPPLSPAVQPLRALLKAGQSTTSGWTRPWQAHLRRRASPAPQQYPSPVPLTPSLGCSPSSTESLSGDIRMSTFNEHTLVAEYAGTQNPLNQLVGYFHFPSYTIITPKPVFLTRWTYLVPSIPRLNLVDSAGLAASSTNSPALARIQVVRGWTSPTPTHPPPNRPRPCPACAPRPRPSPSLWTVLQVDGSAHPISKSDIIRERLPHDARRAEASASVSETPTASPDVSRRVYPRHGLRPPHPPRTRPNPTPKRIPNASRQIPAASPK
ncbi:hypothetical protein B0H14DRAFT_3731358 [Mycena olivaceomarginata]|nr:hypothetical protein B0H14DRAFT_3731358 [Mycena olivaceomarginata]